MHIELQNGKMLNTFRLADVKQGYSNKKSVIIYLTNGTKILEGLYKTEEEANNRVEELRENIKY